MRALLVPFVIPLLAAAASAQANCGNTSTGMIPLTDLGPETYQGFGGGLYPAGANMRPPAHDAAGLVEAAQVVPRNAAGAPDPNGKIVLLSIGMSNTSGEFSTFLPIANADPGKNPAVLLVNGAQGGQTAAAISSPNAVFWTVVDQRLAMAGVTPAQVQAVWFKEANAGPTQPFPDHALVLKTQFAAIMGILRNRYPNGRLCYASSRIYAGYASTPLNPEPWAYESAFAVKWLIEDQANGAPALNFGPANGPVVSPWIAWGPYLWADGLTPRSDGLAWQCSDLTNDGTHPSPSGRTKVASLLLDFFKTDATAKSWFLAGPAAPCGPQAQVEEYGTGFGGPNGTVHLVASRLPTVPTISPFRAHAFGGPPDAIGGFVLGGFPLADGQVPLLGGSLLAAPALGFPIGTNALGMADLDFGPVPPDLALCGGEVYLQYLVADPDSPQGADLSRGLRVRIGH
ncbi:MAG: hypothetical protein L0323_04345 [Planctomycetes bacterium]|nr:hypothetical protein [Planctomycetota bacterium]